MSGANQKVAGQKATDWQGADAKATPGQGTHLDQVDGHSQQPLRYRCLSHQERWMTSHLPEC